MKRKSIIQFFIVAIVLVIAIYKWTGDSDNNKEIDNNLRVTIGEITDSYSSFPENEYVKYKYIVKNKGTYNSKSEVGILKRSCKYKIGDKFKVEYSSLSPQKSRIVLNCKISDTLSINSPPELILCGDCE